MREREKVISTVDSRKMGSRDGARLLADRTVLQDPDAPAPQGAELQALIQEVRSASTMPRNKIKRKRKR